MNIHHFSIEKKKKEAYHIFDEDSSSRRVTEFHFLFIFYAKENMSIEDKIWGDWGL